MSDYSRCVCGSANSRVRSSESIYSEGDWLVKIVRHRETCRTCGASRVNSDISHYKLEKSTSVPEEWNKG